MSNLLWVVLLGCGSLINVHQAQELQSLYERQELQETKARDAAREVEQVEGSRATFDRV